MPASSHDVPKTPHLRVVDRRRVAPLDETVVAAARRGDRAARSEVIAHVLPLARVLVAAVVRDVHRRDDVVQQACIEVLRALPSYEGRASVRGWARSIILRTAFRHMRKASRRARMEVPAGDPDALSRPLAARPEDGVPRPILEYLARLSPKHREVLVLRHVLEYTVPEIADLLGASPNTVKSRLLAARRQIRRHLRRDLRFGAVPSEP